MNILFRTEAAFNFALINLAPCQCSCKRGFRLSADGRTCQNINECLEQKPCDKTNGICKDIRGSYECSFKSGHQLFSDKKACKGIRLFLLVTFR